MYCVKCGRKAREGEKHCPKCGMRLVSPARLKRLLEESSQRARRERQKAKLKADLQRILSSAGAFLKNAYAKLQTLLAALLVWLKANLPRLWAAIKTAAQNGKIVAQRLYKKARRTIRRGVRRLRARLADAKQQRAGKGTLSVRDKSAPARKAPVSTRPSGAAVWRASAAKPGTSPEKRRVPPPASKTGASAAKRPSKAAPPRKLSFRQKLRRFWKRATDEKHLRSTVAMGLLIAALLLFFGWSTLTNPGRRTYARLGMGSARGYVLLGDEYMQAGNYGRAVETYYNAITKKPGFEAAYKLAVAYSYTGDVNREVSALLYCAEGYPQYRAPFVQLYRLYPDEAARPARVQSAIEAGLARYGSLE